MGIPFKYTPPKFYVLPSRPDLSEANADLRERPTQIDEILAYGYSSISVFEKLRDESGPNNCMILFIYKEKGKYGLGLFHYPFPTTGPDYEEYTAESDWTALTEEALNCFKRDLLTDGIHYNLVDATLPEDIATKRILTSPNSEAWTAVNRPNHKHPWIIEAPWAIFFATPHPYNTKSLRAQ